MKTQITGSVLAILVFAVAPALADDDRGGRRHGGRGDRCEHRIDRLTQELELSEEQVSLLREALATGREGAGRGRRARFRDALEDVLRPDQLQKLEAIRDQRRGRRQAHRLDRLTRRLDLDARQVEQIRRILNASRPNREAWRSMDRDQRRRARRAHRDAVHQRIRSRASSRSAGALRCRSFPPRRTPRRGSRNRGERRRGRGTRS